MNRAPRRLRAVALASLAAACGLAACGDSDERRDATEDADRVDGSVDAHDPDAAGPDVAPPDASGDTRDSAQSDGVDDDADASAPDCEADPGATLCPCTANADCNSSFCIPSSRGDRICTTVCDAQCPVDLECKLIFFPGQDPTYLCVDRLVNLCRPCRSNSECQGAFGQVGDRCVEAGPSEGAFCGVACGGAGASACPAGTVCEDVADVETGATTAQCVPSEGECACSPRAILEAASTVCSNGGCAGSRVCTEEGLTACDAPAPTAEVCDGVDNNCNGATDEGFPDSDGDSVADCVDPDVDGDGWPNDDDNCPSASNPDQTDRDEDSVGDACDPPPPPEPSHVEPASPANDNGPTLHGAAEIGLVVRVHAGPSCAGAPLTEVLTEPDGAFAAAMWVPDDSTTTWSLAAWDASFDLASPCAPLSLTYVEDSTPPTAPTLNATSPASPSPDPAPLVSGAAEPGATLTLFGDPACASPLGVTAVAGAQGGFAAPVTVAANAETAMYATATDAAMNASPCSAVLRYRHDDVPPTPPAFTATIPPSPSDAVTDPILLGAAEAGATVTVFAAEGCAGASVATTVASPAGLFSVGVAVAPNSATAFTATATDVAGNTSSCSPTPRVYLHDDEDPAPPSLVGTTPPSPGATTTPTVFGTTEPLATVRVFLGAGCTGFLIGTVAADDAGAFSVVVPVAANAETSLYARAVDLAGRTSACTPEPLRYRHDDNGPTPPVFTGTTPPSPSPVPQPIVHGLAEPLAELSLHTDPSCVSPPVAEVDADDIGAFSVAIAAADNATTTLWARATNAAGLVSACSAGSIDYVHDDTPPAAPVLTATNPESPSSTLTPSILGDAEPTSRVAVFDDADCEGLPLGEADADAAGAFAVPVTVTPNGATTLYATASDAAGNVSPCSTAPLAYLHDGSEPLVPTLIATSPASPSRLTTTPTLIGQAEAETTVTIHLDPDCADAAIATTPVTAGGQFSVAAPATPNGSTTFYAAATSASGVPSPCSPQGLTYVHDDVAPPPPAFTAPVPASPSSTTTAPLLRGLAEAGAQVSVYTSSDCASAWVGSVNVLSVGTFSLAVAVPPDTTLTFYATATDAAGNVSACTADGLAWTHDGTAPPPPILTATEPPAPAATTTPTVLGTAEPLSAVRLYADAACAGSLVGQGAADAGGAFAITALVGANQSTSLRATATDAAGNVSACSAPLAFLNDTDAPAAPTWLGSNPPSPTAGSTTPTLHGAAEAVATVRLYVDAPCTGPPVSTTTSATDGTFSFDATVTANSVTRFYADALDAVGNPSPCSPALVYVHDTAAPSPPVVVATAPASPSTDATPTVSGTAEVGATIRVYLSGDCAGPVAGTTTAGAGGGWAAPAVGPVADNATSSLHATATDAAGNTSACSAGLPYTHDTTPPLAPVVTHTTPEAPSNVGRPRVLGTSEPDALVRVYPNPDCTGTHRGVAYADGDGAFSVEAQASLNTTTTFYATAEDAAGNVGPCSATWADYLHDGVPPARPVMVATTPDRWSAVVSAPLVTGTAEALSAVQIYGAANCSGSTLATTTATAGGDFAATAEIGPANAEARFAARARDVAGNLSPCSSVPLDYRFDDTPPTFAGATAATLGFETTSSGTLSWSPASDNFTPSSQIVYVVCLSTRCGATDCDFDDPSSPLLYTTSPGATSRLISGLAPNTRYYAVVRARDEVGNEDANTAIVSFKTEGLNAATDLAMGENVACVILANGAQNCWGPGTLPSSISDRAQIAIGPNHGCAVMRSGQVRCWNSNQFGQLGNGTTSSTSTTSSVVVSGISDAAKVGVGQFHSCALLSDGRVLCWGRDEQGQVGNGLPISADQLTPTAVTVDQGGLTPLTGAVDLVVGGNHACALRADGSAWCWGANGSGQLGLGDNQQRWWAVAAPIAGLAGITAGQAHTCGLHSDGRVSCWGWNAWGQVGDGTWPFDANGARDVGLEDVVSVRAGGLHTCAVRADGAAACWGQNTSGQAGTGAESTAQDTPHLIDLGAVAQIGAGNGYTCARTHSGRAFCFGDGQGGRLGQGGSTADSLDPVEVIVPRGLSGVTSVSLREAHACVTMSDGSARCWGKNGDGQLGGGEASPDPGALTVVAPLPSAAPLARVAAGARHSCALGADGRVSCWGANHAGQLGQAGVASATTPAAVAGLEAVKALAVGDHFACALGADGAVRCWGDNSHGQLGRGTSGGSSPTPAELPLGGVVEVAAGARHACARTQSGLVYCWGDDAAGQISSAAAPSKTSPALVADLDGVTGLAAGAGHTCARRVTGELVCWGDNTSGQLGRGVTGGVLAPASVANVGGFVALTAGVRHTCGVRFTGDAYCWGDNSAGEIGINLGTASFDTPRAVVGLGVARGIAAGADRTCAHDRFGQAWCWGDNGDGALGDGGVDNAKAPKRVLCLP